MGGGPQRSGSLEKTGGCHRDSMVWQKKGASTWEVPRPINRLLQMDWGSQNRRPDLVIGAADLMSLGTHGLPKEGQRGLVWMFGPGEQTRDGMRDHWWGEGLGDACCTSWRTGGAAPDKLGEQRQMDWGSNARWIGAAASDDLGEQRQTGEALHSRQIHWAGQSPGVCFPQTGGSHVDNPFWKT